MSKNLMIVKMAELPKNLSNPDYRESFEKGRLESKEYKELQRHFGFTDGNR